MSLPPDEIKSQKLELKKMFLPEMLLDKIKSLNLKLTESGLNDLEAAMQSELPGSALLRLIDGSLPRIRDTLLEDSSNANSADNLKQTAEVERNLKIISNDLQLLKQKYPSDNASNWVHVNQMLATAIMIGYQAGGHDMKVNVERHANKGFEAGVTTPQKGGNAKAKTTVPIKNLVIDMATHIYNQQNLKSASKALLAEAIHSRLEQFSLSGDNKKTLELLSAQKSSLGLKTIKNCLKNVPKPKDTQEIPKPSLSRLIDELKASFKSQTIKASLKN